MKENEELNLGEQPISAIMAERGMKNHDVVAASEVPMTHKMVMRAVRGRRLTKKTQLIVLNALNRATGEDYCLSDLFNY